MNTRQFKIISLVLIFNFVFIKNLSAEILTQPQKALGLSTRAVESSTPLDQTDLNDFRILENLVDGPVRHHHSGLQYGLHTWGDSGVRNNAYASVMKELQQRVSQNPQLAQLIQYGQSIEGRPLNLIRIEDRNAHHPENCVRPAVQIAGAIHGNEYVGIEDKLVHHFLQNYQSMPGLSLFLAQGGVVYMLPISNPDGYDHRRRANARGADLNRDFDLLPRNEKHFQQPETRSLANYLDQDLEQNKLNLKLNLDYHCCIPAFLTPWSYENLMPHPEDQATFKNIIEVENSILGYEAGTPSQVIGYTASGSTMDYYYAKYGTLSLAIEGQYGGEIQRFNQHIQMWDQFFLKIAEKEWGYSSQLQSPHQCLANL